MKTQSILAILVFLGLAAVGSKIHAVNPPPDGGYPGGNTAEGQNALFSLTSGTYNTAVGFLALRSNIAGNFNTAIGAGSLLVNTADQNTATGAGALLSNTTGVNNTANGAFALFNNTIGGDNTANGPFALLSNTTGNDNTANGISALQLNTTGSHNIGLGFAAGAFITTASNVICIGNVGQNVSNSCFIDQIFGATSSGGTAVFINSDGKLGTSTSARRFKEEIKPMERASEALYVLKPVTFRYKKGIDPQGIPQFGLVAEDVEAVNPDLVVRDADGTPYSVRYDQVNAMLLNEFLKEHRKVEKLETIVTRQQEQIEALTAGLQKVTAQMEMKERTTQIANNQ